MLIFDRKDRKEIEMSERTRKHWKENANGLRRRNRRKRKKQLDFDLMIPS